MAKKKAKAPKRSMKKAVKKAVKKSVKKVVRKVAAKTAPHVPSAWETLNLHQTLGWWTVGLFTALSLWRWRLGRKAESYFLAAWLVACGVLLATGFQGGELVFTHAMGVATE